MKVFYNLLFQSLIMSDLALAMTAPRKNLTIPVDVIAVSPPPPPPHPSTSTLPVPPSPTTTLPGPPPHSSMPMPMAGNGASCGQGYTYCGYLLTQGGHNFQTSDITKAYCSGLPDLCPGGKPKTDVGQALFYCLDDKPNAAIELVCACSGKCLNDPQTNHIGHCDKPCVNS
ncbi:hypothetical protein F4810DRAFT_348790 [Camillea tinctor]|nr:hypothetical protein F4810DRAFT_348790 [Camillea tinctor]